ncbi:GNAT family N-acetyltransferase [Nocardioides marinquilinus]|uniref:GNAT family N-acetyltransferase n=1 Tax=Nocardioides marinquilinus TaxID=1210400 RepID=A0ABP9PWQ2_9ACTN
MRPPEPDADPGSDPDTGQVVVRPATVADLPAVSRVHLASRAAAPMPPSVHDDSEHLPFLIGRLEAGEELWVAEDDGDPGGVVAYVRLTDTWLDDLYVAPHRAGQGLGSMLLDLAKARRPSGFSLWVFESNAPARAFYARHGLLEREHTDGAENEEHEPDLRMEWPGATA